MALKKVTENSLFKKANTLEEISHFLTHNDGYLYPRSLFHDMTLDYNAICVYIALNVYSQENYHTPSIRQIIILSRVKSYQTVNKSVKKLVDRGWINVKEIDGVKHYEVYDERRTK